LLFRAGQSLFRDDGKNDEDGGMSLYICLRKEERKRFFQDKKRKQFKMKGNMRSLVLAVAAVIASATMSIASAQSSNNSVKNQNEINFSKLSYALNLTPAQVNQVYDITSDFQANMQASNTDKQVMKSIYSNLAQMKGTLTQEQYLKYVAMINLTANNQMTTNDTEGYFAQK
jgi:predicted nucleotidyltransferase